MKRLLVAAPAMRPVAAVPLKHPAVAPVKPVPVSITLALTGPLGGERLVSTDTGSWLGRPPARLVGGVVGRE